MYIYYRLLDMTKEKKELLKTQNYSSRSWRLQTKYF
jgi:hypothetical protein